MKKKYPNIKEEFRKLNHLRQELSSLEKYLDFQVAIVRGSLEEIDKAIEHIDEFMSNMS